MNQLKDIKCFCLDMDGTIYLSDVLFNGALQAVERLQKQGRVIFLTNNSSCTRKEYFDKLKHLGFKLSLTDIYGSGNATIDYLNAKHNGKSVYLLGSNPLKQEFAAAGIRLFGEKSTSLRQMNHSEGAKKQIYSFYASENKDNPQVAVLAFDKTLTYQKLEEFCHYLNGGAFFVATHPDKTCPTANGYIPDVGSFLRLIKCATGKSPDIVCGKPSKEYGRRILSLTGLKPSQIAMIGDRLATDIRFAYNCGFKSVLVLSGETKKSDLGKLKADGKRLPDIVLDSISDWDKI